MFGIIDWYTMLQHEDPMLQQYEKTLMGDPDKDRSVYEAASPIKFIRNEKAPLLVLQGENDIRVPEGRSRAGGGNPEEGRPDGRRSLLSCRGPRLRQAREPGGRAQADSCVVR